MTEIKDLVERLRHMANTLRQSGNIHRRFHEGMDEAASALTAAQARIEQLERERDEARRDHQAWYKRALDAERERDEALEQRDIWQEHHCCAVRERDEARAALREISAADNIDLALDPEWPQRIARSILGGDQTGATPAGWDERLSSLTTLVYPTPSPSEERYRQALTPSVETKAAYIGEFHFLQEAYSEEFGEEVTCRVTVPWTTIKEIMAAIRAFAALSPTQPEGGDVPSEPTSSALGNSDNDHTAVADGHGQVGGQS